MFDIPDETVNLTPLSQSTIIGGLAAARLPLWWRLTYRLLEARCIYCDTLGDLGEIDLCSGCLQTLPWSRLLNAPESALFDYRPAVSRSVLALKFGGEFRHAAVLGTLLGLYWRETLHHLERPLIAPVPLHRDRLRERGFNQVAMLARYASRVVGWPLYPQLLIRTRYTTAQTRLEAHQRHQNVQGAFCAARPPTSPGQVVILLDDVVTTGATLQVAGIALEQAGYQVQPWAVARAMPMKMTSPIV
jgi:ComF family protein